MTGAILYPPSRLLTRIMTLFAESDLGSWIVMFDYGEYGVCEPKRF